MLDCSLNDWQFGLMVRDITTTYNVWNIDEKSTRKLPTQPGQNQELPESTEITAPKAQMGLSKKSLSVMTTALWLHQYEIYKTNDLISTDFVSVDPALGFEFGYTDLVLSVQE
jgi:hypothetical protein